jgi:hypothetical protein
MQQLRDLEVNVIRQTGATLRWCFRADEVIAVLLGTALGNRRRNILVQMIRSRLARSEL